MKNILISVGTRPNIIKITQFKRIATDMGLDLTILHTGQHYDHKMAQVFYDQFGFQPDIRKSLKPGSVLQQITQMMHDVTDVIAEVQPDILLTPGDVNSTFAAAYAAYQQGVPVGHIESGLRSDDMTMPEEVNRILTDDITDHYFITEPSGVQNLGRLGKSSDRLHRVGNTMIDTLVAFAPQIDDSTVREDFSIDESFLLMTFHRPGNVDEKEPLAELVQLINETSRMIQCVFPVHPRTKKRLEEVGLLEPLLSNSQVILTDPLGYFDFQHLVKHASLVVTDSGGIQEETTFRQIPCLTIRPNTERPITIDEGTNELMPFHVDSIVGRVKGILEGDVKRGRVPNLWDGQSTRRILEVIKAL